MAALAQCGDGGECSGSTSTRAAHVDVWYSPHWADFTTHAAPPDLFPLLNTPATAWPRLAARTSTFKLKMQPLLGNNTRDVDLAALAAIVSSRGMKTGLRSAGGLGLSRTHRNSNLHGRSRRV